MTIHEAQIRVDNWIRKYGVRYFSELTNLALLMEETGELARIMARRFGEQSVKSGESSSSFADELADILFVLICLANQTGVDLQQAFENNLAKKTARDFKRHRENPKLREEGESGAEEK
jgi:NTP pyrophosphatase (non-canonical NTP hydrolase)